MYSVNGTTNKAIAKSIPLSPAPSYMVVNPKTNMIYVAGNKMGSNMATGSNIALNNLRNTVNDLFPQAP
ncbi:MAG: hypothetical protein WBQ25_01905 [Nitrososphaeraceae archaeon]